MDGSILLFSDVTQIYFYCMLAGFGLSLGLGLFTLGIVSVVRLFRDIVSKG